MAIVIPDFNRRVEPLNEVLEAAYLKAGRRTKRAIKGMCLRNLSWGAIHETVFQSLQNSLRKAVKLSYPKDGKELCVYTDASDKFWSGLVTQTDPELLQLPLEEQQHEPLAFLGSEFRKAELNWSTFEKEGFAIFQTFEKLYYIFHDDHPTHVFTDHRNLLFIFAPYATEPTIGRHIVSKVQRWAMYLSRFEYVIEHIDGKRNICADMLTRWTKGYRNERLSTKSICCLVSTADQVVPSAGDIDWPTRETIRASQQSAGTKPSDTHEGEDQILRRNDRIWIPADDTDMKLRILIASHCGSMGHRGQEATESVLREDFLWEGMHDDVTSFVRGCLHCIITRSGEIVPRPLGHALHGEKPNEVLHVDFLYMGQSSAQLKYVLIIRDDFSSYVWLWPTPVATAEAAAEALATWVAVFGAMDWMVSDQGPHFKNQLMHELTEELKGSHHFATAYSPWSNGTVERVCREVLRACRALLHEFRLAPEDWSSVTECMQSVLNQSPLKRLGLRSEEQPGVYRTPLEVFTSHKPTRPLLRALHISPSKNVPNLEEIRARQLIEIHKTQDALEKMHRQVGDRITASRLKSIEKYQARTNSQPAALQRGYFVLVRRAQKKGHKLQFLWRGPLRVKEVKSQWVYVIEDLASRRTETIHARRLLLYRNALDNTEVEPKLLQFAAHNETQYQDAKGLCDIRQGSTEIELLVEWIGLPDTIDMTWEPLSQVREDLPGVLHDYLFTANKRSLKQKTMSICGFTDEECR